MKHVFAIRTALQFSSMLAAIASVVVVLFLLFLMFFLLLLKVLVMFVVVGLEVVRKLHGFVKVFGVVGLPGLGDVLLDGEVEDGDQEVEVR
jgi:hypothetical protein